MAEFSPTSFRAQWEQDTSLDFGNRTKRKYRHYCAYGHRFSLWAEELLSQVTASRTLLSVQHAKLLLVDKYFEWRSFAPRSHQDRTSTRQGHICIFQVFIDAYEALKTIELSLTPPPPLLPAPQQPKRPSPPQVYGIELGEEDDEFEAD